MELLLVPGNNNPVGTEVFVFFLAENKDDRHNTHLVELLRGKIESVHSDRTAHIRVIERLTSWKPYIRLLSFEELVRRHESGGKLNCLTLPVTHASTLLVRHIELDGSRRQDARKSGIGTGLTAGL